MFLDPIDGWDLIIEEMFKFHIKHGDKVNDVASVLDDYISINDIKNRKDERRKWNKLWEIADILSVYRVVVAKDFTFASIDELIVMPLCNEKSQKIDQIVKYIVEDISSSLKHKIGKIIGNDTLLMSIKDSMKLQEMIEGQSRAYDVVRIYSDVVIDQKKYDLPKAVQKKEPEVYAALQKVIMDRLTSEFQGVADEVQNRVGDEKVSMVIANHQTIIKNLDVEDKDIKDYFFFLKIIELIIDCFTGEDDVTSKINLSQWYEKFRNGELIEELFHKTSDLDRYDDLIYELKNNVFIFVDKSFEYITLKGVIQWLLKKWSQHHAGLVKAQSMGKFQLLTF